MTDEMTAKNVIIYLEFTSNTYKANIFFNSTNNLLQNTCGGAGPPKRIILLLIKFKKSETMYNY